MLRKLHKEYTNDMANWKQIGLISGVVVGTTAITIGIAYIWRHELLDKYKKMTTGDYFSIDELVYSNTAKARGIDNTPPKDVEKNLRTLIKKCLNPIREIYGKPIIISSGYRCEELNNAVGGAKTSQHKSGNAVDLVPANGGSLKEIFESAVKFGKYDQLIYEENSKGSKWVHVSYDDNRQRGQILSYKNGKYTDITNNWKNYVV